MTLVLPDATPIEPCGVRQPGVAVVRANATASKVRLSRQSNTANSSNCALCRSHSLFGAPVTGRAEALKGHETKRRAPENSDAKDAVLTGIVSTVRPVRGAWTMSPPPAYIDTWWTSPSAA